jgi:DNA mismatch repair protein MutL
MTPRPIHPLPQSLVNRIAAGEVIERPASVVKELVENAIDAGATAIAVEIEDGGTSLIRVVDNGGGIPVSDLALAFAPHATSKLTSDEDLFNIVTMGFRGEALASIGSVSQARILSRTAGEGSGLGAQGSVNVNPPDLSSSLSPEPSSSLSLRAEGRAPSPSSSIAYEIFDRGGAISDPQAAAGNVGTTVEVRNLFFNVPARRKFLKGPATEYGHVSEMLQKLALPHPQVAFSLVHNGRKAMNLPAVSDATQRWLSAWPEEFHEQRLPVEARDAEVRLTGIIGLPELARPVAKYQYLYLNGRPIRDKFIQHALREAYRGLTEPGRHPAAILLLTIPPGDVDVNVHPTKFEVRFKDSGRIHGLVMSAIREVLLGSDLAPGATLRADAPAVIPDAQRSDMQQKLATFFREMPAQMSTPVLPMNFAQSPEQLAEDRRSFGRAANQDGEISDVPFSRIGEGSGLREAQPQPRGSVNTNAPGPSSLNPEPRVLNPLPAIQLHNSYLVASSEDGLLIIDQHALHERIMFEELFARVTRGPLESQRLLIPLTLPASPRQIELANQIQPLLARLGIELSTFGPATLAVQSFPSFLERMDPAEFIRELLEKGEQELLDMHEEELLHEVLDMMACKAAVKAGDPLTQQEIEALLARRELVERSSNCPHGRPTTLRLTLRDLEKQFKRTGF